MNNFTQITQSEIDRYKSLFDEKIGHFSLIFDKDENGEESLKLYDGESGIDASWTGSVALEQDYFVKWSFSIINGAHVEANIKLNDENKKVVENIYNFFVIWRDELKKYLSGGGAEGAAAEPEMAMGGEEIVSGGPAETSPEGEKFPIGESIRSKENIISENSDRMKRLAGL